MRCSHCWRLAFGDWGCLLGQLDDQAPQATMSSPQRQAGSACQSTVNYVPAWMWQSSVAIDDTGSTLPSYRFCSQVLQVLGQLYIQAVQSELFGRFAHSFVC